MGVAAAVVRVANAIKKDGGVEEEANTTPQIEVQKKEKVILQMPQMAQSIWS